MDDVSNYEDVVDATDDERITVAVGAEGNGGNFAFDPPAVRVSPGTTVTWQWSGKGGTHNVVATDGTFDSGAPAGEAGTEFAFAFDDGGAYPYYCVPHKSLGMKGIVVVE
ncbi:MAG: halocyanin domain-containing protein [Haloarculaceae archaeon]